MTTFVSTPASDQALKNFAIPIWHNAYWARNALEMYEGVSKHAAEINKTKHGHFFGLTQQFALDKAVIVICKLYETGNKNYPKHTVPELVDFFESNFQESQARFASEKNMVELSIEQESASIIHTKLNNSATFTNGKKLLIDKLKEKIPAPDSHPALKRIFIHRNKIGAHQERIDAELRETIRDLPSLDDMYKLTAWAEDFCHFIMNILSTDTTYTRSCMSARMAALNVAAKILDKNLDNLGYEECKKFFEKIE